MSSPPRGFKRPGPAWEAALSSAPRLFATTRQTGSSWLTVSVSQRGRRRCQRPPGVKLHDEKEPSGKMAADSKEDHVSSALCP